MDQSVKFWDKIAEKYSKQPVADEVSYQKKLKVTQAYFKSDMQVLELGCGTGSTAIVHAPFVEHIRAVDVSPNMIEIAKRKAEAKQIANITFEVSAVESLNVVDESMDVVMAHSLLHLLEGKEAVIARIFEMLKPGGLFVSSTMCMNDAMWFLKPVIPMMRLFGKAPEVVRFFSAKQLLKSVTDAGFEINYKWHPGKTKAVFIVAKKPD
ncbi:putative methyltransferase YcgJ [Mariprofundus micogutta]|uniref:Putative methyltransferase YcgJ n=1 Tax=Mariprofundus micogutta TaxID=1921010 RepID=A0A1L8CND3_9PROT|nr:class I SAM-dependent methyltransferase [Mariprofundus micogutta]GAV20432.1 putative methyltransferase YcgJ [Mariprofundus micogutta]